MTHAPTPQQAATNVIVHDVHAQHRSDYERWIETAVQAHQRSPGHLATDIIRPVDACLRYVVILRFTTGAHAHAWLVSPERTALLKQAYRWLRQPDQYQVHATGDFWFQAQHGQVSPSRWKQWLLSSVAVFPLTMLVPPAIARVIGLLAGPAPELATHALAATVISAVMVYWLMPTLSRLAGGWLLR